MRNHARKSGADDGSSSPRRSDAMPAGMAAAETGRPLYARIERSLREGILGGLNPVGSLLPAETELCAHFGVSRYTVREALRRLTEAGLVSRRQGAGTVVISAQAPRVFVQSARSLEDLFQYAIDTRLIVEEAKTAAIDAEEAQAIKAEPGSLWLRVRGVRRDAAGHAICTVTVFVAERFAAVAEDLPGLKGSIFARIENRWGAPIASVMQEVSAARMSAEVARALGARRNAVGMRFLRRYADAEGEAVLTSINWHPADRFVHATHLRRNDDGSHGPDRA
jgi:DNA-binding GntR family transcriptional regulator